MRSFAVNLRDALSAGNDMVLVIVAVVLIAIVLIVGVALFILKLYSPKGRVQLLLDSKGVSRPSNRWVVRAIVLLTFALLVGGVGWYAGQPSSCRSCHQEPVYSEGLEASVHAQVGCMRCHRQTGALSSLRNTVRYSGWLWSAYVDETKVEPGRGTFIDSRACLSCHGSILDETIKSDGVAVRHKDFVLAGDVCVDCHGSVGHSEARGVQAEAVMNRCMQCHNGDEVQADCATCHVEDLGVRTALLRDNKLGTVGLTDTSNCYACHQQGPCTECHGVVMPHPRDWSNPPPQGLEGTRFIMNPGTIFPPGSHSREGFKNREICWRCHHKEGQIFEPDDTSCICHGLLGSWHGGPVWVQEHGPQAIGAKTGSMANCGQCHGPPETFCTTCHDPSYAKRYAPIVGPDRYRPSPGYTIGDPRTM